MKIDFDISDSKGISLIFSLLLCAFVFSILPISISARDSQEKKIEISAVKVFSAKDFQTQKKQLKTSTNGVENFSEPTFKIDTQNAPLGNFSVSNIKTESVQIGGIGSENFGIKNFQGEQISAQIGTFELSQLDKIPRRLNEINVKYPADLLRRGVEAEVRIQLTILEDGSVSVDGIESSTDARFDECALAAASKLIYEIPTKNGKPARAQFILPMPFKILK